MPSTTSDTTGVHPTNKFIRSVVHATEAPPPIAARFFYTSPLAIDDPLSPLPPPATGASTAAKQPPRPFSVYDNAELEKAWMKLRQQIYKWNEDNGGPGGEKSGRHGARETGKRRMSAASTPRSATPRRKESVSQSQRNSIIRGSNESATDLGLPGLKSNGYAEEMGSSLGKETGEHFGTDNVDTTRNPFIRAPTRRTFPTTGSSQQRAPSKPRPPPQPLDSYDWGEDHALYDGPHEEQIPQIPHEAQPSPEARVPVGVSRLHNVVMPDLQMEPVYWKPVHDIAAVVRATWFYKDTMLPVEVDVANMLEAGYVSLRPWTETWNDELNSAVEVGALGEMKIAHRLWPEKPPKVESRPQSMAGRDSVTNLARNPDEDKEDPEKERKETVASAGDIIDAINGPNGPDNKAAGTAPFGKDGYVRTYTQCQVIYANEKDAYVLQPRLQPSDYYGRKPLSSYIRHGRSIGIQVVRGFDQRAWDKLHPTQSSAKAAKARDGVSTSADGTAPKQRQQTDATLSQSERATVTDLILVIHGIGQKLSERVESFHFTHAINAFRREVNVELGTENVKGYLRDDMGGVMVLPVNWRLSLSFEDGGYRNEGEDPAFNQYSLKDITPESLPSVRQIISEVLVDIPYYLSEEQKPKMIAACVGEANRIYRLWCLFNPGFQQRGRVHLIAHSLGSVMAVDILSQQPTRIPPHLSDPTKIPESDLPKTHFLFDTSSLFCAGSPAGFFLLLKRAPLLPRLGREKVGAEDFNSPGVAGEHGTYGCLAVDNIYNVINPYDPVSYRLNATVDADYAATLRAAFIPSSNTSWFSGLKNPFRGSSSGSNTRPSHSTAHNPLPRLPSNVELETHNFTREEIAEKRAYLLNDNGQIDFFLRYGGGPLEIQYLTMLGAHSSYWITRDFVRMIVVEVGRKEGREGTVPGMRAVKKPLRP
ncbi:hypothetical protein K402DRAFT_372296 [Aulographum hederae CBS 113979]|uniref:DDHD domain-containing protein n=1 Tax=Aulographum hederae CBS 113979 TaxID=1176131 RepID=A0A6G1H8G9_9PEZI|nr:hypothetical protein K402DRAFT_372296 [Aulographum hederae CBS 113979]